MPQRILLTVRAPLMFAAMCISLACLRLSAQSPMWSLDAKPMLVLGKSTGEESEAFAAISGATRLPNGNVLVADRGEFSMHIYSPAGKEVKKFGRSGSGPGEFKYLARLYRCGSSVLAYDIDGSLISVFALDATLTRSFRFSTKVGNGIPYASACNKDGVFLHFGWEQHGEIKTGVYRARVPLWLSSADSSVGRSLGTIEGSERWGQPHGSGPLPLGREPRIAIGASRAYVGDATTYAIRVFSLDGRRLGDITKSVKTIRVTTRDIDAEVERQVASSGAKSRPRLEKYFAEIALPKTLPPYRDLMVDATDNLWVQDYARSAPSSVTWTVFDPTGKQLVEVQMPHALDVYEIGADYVLGRFLDPEESIPQVRMYRLMKRVR